MERIDYRSVGDVLRQTIEESRLDTRLDEVKAAALWQYVVGPDIAAECLKPYVAGGVMRVRVPNASLRQELEMNRSALIAEINRMLGKEVLKGMRFTG